MKKYKICVYAICKNEEKFVERWYESVKEADYITVLDTGSTDKTLEKLKNCGVNVVSKEIKPWRFDNARNESMKLIPPDTDICVCLDLDEVFEAGWTNSLRNSWDELVTRARYLYNWSFDSYGVPATTFYINKIHKYGIYKWVHPVHEVLSCMKEENEILVKDIVLNHYPDSLKSRGSYLPLLELSVKEDKLDDRNMHYLGREYMYYGRSLDSIKTLKRHLRLKSATWRDERSASMRFIARGYLNLNNKNLAYKWYKKAITEAPHLREAYIELAYLYYTDNKYLESYFYLRKAFEIKEKSISYINEVFAWNSFPNDLMSIVAFNLELYNEAYKNAKKALSMDKDNLRLQLNLEQMEKYI